MNNQNTAEMSFEDSENHSGAENLSIKQIVLKNVQTCMMEGSKEMDGGGVRRRIINNIPLEVYAPNQREIFINSVDMLWILVKPFYNPDNCKDSRVIEIIGRIDENESELDNLSNEALNKKFSWVVMNTHNSKNCHRAKSEYHNCLIKICTEFREKTKVSLYRERLIAISLLLKTLDYFEESGFSS